MRMINIYAYYDKKAKNFDTPFHTYNHVFAERKYRQDVTNEGSLLKDFSEDFELFYFGQFDKMDGIYHIKEKPQMFIDSKGERLIKKEDTEQFYSEQEMKRAISDATQIQSGS